MIATEARIPEESVFAGVPGKKLRTDSTSSADSALTIDPSGLRNLELEGVKELFQDYDLLEAEDVACVICGKHYKSKVCVKKHLWEHSIYWDLFDGLKKQQRVLSIQAAIILAIRFNPSLAVLLVTSSSTGTKKKSTDKPPDKPPNGNSRKRKFEDTNVMSDDKQSNCDHARLSDQPSYCRGRDSSSTPLGASHNPHLGANTWTSNKEYLRTQLDNKRPVNLSRSTDLLDSNRT